MRSSATSLQSRQEVHSSRWVIQSILRTKVPYCLSGNIPTGIRKSQSYPPTVRFAQRRSVLTFVGSSIGCVRGQRINRLGLFAVAD